MKIFKLNIFSKKPIVPKTVTKKQIPPCPIDYDPNNVTREEYHQYVSWLAKYGINHTFHEPKKFTTPAERAERERYAAFVRHLAESGSNRTFIQP